MTGTVKVTFEPEGKAAYVLAGSIVLILSALTVIGTFISDILLAWLDPRIRFEGS